MKTSSTGASCMCFSKPPSGPPSGGADGGLEARVGASLVKLLNNLCLKKDGTVNRKLMSLATQKSAASKVPFHGVSSVDIPIETETGVWCRVFVPASVESGKKLPVIVFYHGGGFVLFDSDFQSYDLHCRRMSKLCGAVVVSVSYRSAPEHKCPAAYDDGFTALEWVRSQAGSQFHNDFPVHLADFSRVFISGDSAGGNLAHHVAVKAGASDISPLTLVGVILVQPFFGAEERTNSEMRWKSGAMMDLKHLDWYWRAFLPADADRNHPSCNVTGPRAPPFQPMKLPKLLVITGGRDALQDKDTLYAEMMQSAGKDCKLVSYENAIHGFYAFKSSQSTVALHYEIQEFVNPPTGGGKSATESGTDAAVPQTALARTLSF